MNITYLIGAGASQQCLPIVSNMSKQILKTLAWLKDTVKPNARVEQSDTLQTIISELEALADICKPKKNFSVDTYAKKLQISGRFLEYIKLKNTLTLFFTLQQLRKNPDVRYDNFWASIITQEKKLPRFIKILSWNYDFQLETTYQDFIQSDSLSDTAKELNLITSRSSLSSYKDIDDFTVFKINGSATYNSNTLRDKQNYIINNLKKCSPIQALDEILEYRSVIPEQMENHLSYAWEQNTTSDFFNHLLNCTAFTDILVVIGYSFPYFNRQVDKKIITSMHSLKKVYFQDPQASVIEKRFLAIRNDIGNREVITDIYQFIIPNEL